MLVIRKHLEMALTIFSEIANELDVSFIQLNVFIHIHNKDAHKRLLDTK